MIFFLPLNLKHIFEGSMAQVAECLPTKLVKRLI
jgi:hypothetical protein